MNKLLVLTIGVLFTGLLSTVSITSQLQQAHASIIGDFGIGYNAGKTAAYNGYADNCDGYSNSYCAGFHIGYAGEEAAIAQVQP